MVELGLVVPTEREETIVVEAVELGTTVRMVKVGGTAFRCPKQALYAEAALRSTVGQDAYMHPRATSPSDSPLKL